MGSGAGIFVTGLGILSPLGRGRPATLRSLKDSVRGIRTTNPFNAAPDQLAPVADVSFDFEKDNGVPRTHALALAAARDAMEGCGGAPEAIVIGVTTGGMPKSEALIGSHVRVPAEYAWHGAGSVAAYLAERLSCPGPALTISTACSSGAAAVKVALELIRHGRAKRVLAGGVDALCRFTYYGFFSLQLMDPKGARPLDRDRAGMSLGEGAAMLLLEGAEGPPPGSIAQVLGGAMSCDAYHPTAPHPQGEGALKAMRDAAADSGVSVADIEYVNLHGTATLDNDAAEAVALRALFGERIPPVSSTKGMTGHSLAASGAVEAAICALAVSEGTVPGTIGCTTVDPALGIPAVLHPEERPVRIALSNSFGFGGNNAVLVIGAADVRPVERVRNTPRGLRVMGAACLTGAGATKESFQKFFRGVSMAGALSDEEVSRDLPQRQVRRLKRLPRMALALMAAARREAGDGVRPSSIYFGTGWGCLSETYDFLTKLFGSDMKFSSPTDFINSVHNAPAGQAAMELKATGANVTATGGDYSFEQALLMASITAPEGEEVLLFGADEMHPELSPLFDPSVACGGTPSDGGGAIMAVATTSPSGPKVAPRMYRTAPRDADVGRALMDSLDIARDINEEYGAIFAGIPLGCEGGARGQFSSFLSHTGFSGPVIDYRKFTGHFATSSAAAVVLAVKTVRGGVLPAGLTGTADVSLKGKGILVMGFGPYCTAIDVHE